MTAFNGCGCADAIVAVKRRLSQDHCHGRAIGNIRMGALRTIKTNEDRTLKKSAIQIAIERVQGDIDVLEAVKSRLIALQAREPKRKPRAIKAVAEKVG